VSWTLRAARPEDAEAMAETLQGGFDGYRSIAPPGWLPPDARSAPEVARMRARLGEPSTWATLAEDGGLVAGHAGYFPQPGVPGSAHLWQLFLRPPWWGTGIARALLQEAIAAAAAEGYGRMRLFTPRDQARARAFYEREGFEHTGWEAFEEAIGLVLVEYAREPLERR
jgi:GNAT superfamily N-acetyltransferase